ncbi:metalloregulator ArsR/SmtB family transcription factor [Candidatus Micrarchaeota archaeon]|nr:metalloregulator ArsR/SmtB family transcription factor [Candidatus Micrarchaeota archaeon]
MAVNILKAISDETRFKIMRCLEGKEICACKLPCKVRKTQPAVSQHLKVLRESGLVNLRKDSTRHMYSLSEKGKRVLEDISRW